jgi:hypothetical protein
MKVDISPNHWMLSWNVFQSRSVKHYSSRIHREKILAPLIDDQNFIDNLIKWC